MSKLDDIIDTCVSESSNDNMATDWDGIAETAKQQIKDLMLELIGDDVGEYDDKVQGPAQYGQRVGYNRAKKEWRKKVEEL